MMAASKLRVSVLALILFIFLTQVCVGQSLPACANTCVKKTKTKCKATDFKCACTPKKSGQYMERLTECINDNCGPGGILESYQYLSALCAVAGAPIDRKGGTATDRYELRRALGYHEPLEGRQFDNSFSELPSGTPTPAPFPPATTTTRSSTSTRSSSSATSTTTGGGGGGGGSGGGLSTGAKIGIGLGVPLGVILIGLLVGLGFWLGRRNNTTSNNNNTKEEAAPAYTADPHMSNQGGGIGGLPELSQDAAYRGSELPTKSNTSEMAGSPVSSLQVGGAGKKVGEYFPGQGGGGGQVYSSDSSLGYAGGGGEQPQYGLTYAGGYPQEGYGQSFHAAELPERRDTVGR